jgi:hypothetical protein
MTLEELSRRAEPLDLRIRPVHPLRPSKVTIIGDQAGGHFAFVNDDGLPLFTIQEAAEVIDVIEEAGDYEAWLLTREDGERRKCS